MDVTVGAPDAAEADSLFGCMRDHTVALQACDLTAPILDEPLTAEQGDLHGS